MSATTTTTTNYTGNPIKNLIEPTPSDIVISQSVEPMNVNDLAKSYGILDDEIIPYGKTKAKIDINILNRLQNEESGNVCRHHQILICSVCAQQILFYKKTAFCVQKAFCRDFAFDFSHQRLL